VCDVTSQLSADKQFKQLLFLSAAADDFIGNLVAFSCNSTLTVNTTTSQVTQVGYYVT